jgi:hypothetical protein
MDAEQIFVRGRSRRDYCAATLAPPRRDDLQRLCTLEALGMARGRNVIGEPISSHEH